MRPWRFWWVASLVCLLAACGGGEGDDATPPQPVAASVGAAGGTIQVPGYEGTTLTLELPPDALAATVEFTVTPLPADPGASPRYRIEPAGLLLRARATLRYAAASPLPERAVLRWRAGAQGLALPTTRESNRLTAQSAYLGQASGAGAAALRAGPLASDEGAELEVGTVDCDSARARIEFLLRSAVSVGDEAQAMALYEELQAVMLACQIQSTAAIEQQACNAYASAALAAQAIAADSFAALRSLLAPVMNTAADLQFVGANCEEPRADALLEAKFAQFDSFLAAEFARPEFGQDYESARLELRRLYDYLSVCDLMGAVNACQGMRTRLFPDFFDRLREGAYRACRTQGNLQPLAAMYDESLAFRPIVQGRSALLAAGAGAYLDLGRFTYGELEADLAHCRSALTATSFDDARGVPLQERVVELAAGDAPGSAPAPIEMEIPRNGSLTLDGRVHALQCPDGSLGIDRIVARVGGVEIDSRVLADDWFALDTEPFDLVLVDTLRSALLDPEATSAFVVDVFREGDACQGRFSASLRLYSIRVVVRAITVAITPAATSVAPGGTVAFSAHLAGTTATDVTWSANAGSITASGLFTAPAASGTVTVTARATGDPSASATATVTVAAPARVEGTYSGTMSFTSGGAFPSTVYVFQSVGGEVISARGLFETKELGFALAADGTLTFLGFAATGVERDAKGVPLSWEPASYERIYGSLRGRDLVIDRYALYASGYQPYQRWELSRP